MHERKEHLISVMSSSGKSFQALMNRLEKYDLFKKQEPAAKTAPTATPRRTAPASSAGGKKTVASTIAEPPKKCSGKYKNGNPCRSNVGSNNRKYCNTCGQFPGGVRR